MKHLTTTGAILLALCILTRSTDFAHLALLIFLSGLLLDARGSINRLPRSGRIAMRAGISILIILFPIVSMGDFAILAWTNILATAIGANLLLLLPEK